MTQFQKNHIGLRTGFCNNIITFNILFSRIGKRAFTVRNILTVLRPAEHQTLQLYYQQK